MRDAYCWEQVHHTAEGKVPASKSEREEQTDRQKKHEADKRSKMADESGEED